MSEHGPSGTGPAEGAEGAGAQPLPGERIPEGQDRMPTAPQPPPGPGGPGQQPYGQQYGQQYGPPAYGQSPYGRPYGSAPYGEASGRPVPVAVENFHALKTRQTAEGYVDAADAEAKVNLLNWDGRGAVPLGMPGIRRADDEGGSR